MKIIYKIKSLFKKEQIRLDPQDLYKLKTGDIVGFSGVGAFSQLIKLKTHSKISHVGIVLIENGIHKICESTTLIDTPDCDTGEFIKGVQKHTLISRINNYNGDAYHYPLAVELKDKQAMFDWLNDTHGKKTSYDYVQAICSGLHIKVLSRSSADFYKLFCSELCCKALQVAGVISDKINASKINPKELLQIKIYKKNTLIKTKNRLH